MPRRSRGCEACRRRRIGCDGGTPSCRICLANNRQCSGPILGPVIIDQTAAVRDRQRHTKRSHVVSKVDAGSLRLPSSPPVMDPGLVLDFLQFLTAESVYVDRLRPRQWIVEAYADCLSNNTSAFQVAAKAASIAYYSISQHDAAAARGARSMYTEALRGHSLHMSDKNALPTLSTIGTSVVLSLFEAILPTNPVAYGVHLRAARCLLLDGYSPAPEDPLLQQLARHIQCQTLFVMIATPQEYLRTAPRPQRRSALRNSFVQNTPEALDRLLPVLFMLTDSFVRRVFTDSCDVNQCEEDLETSVDEAWNHFIGARVFGPLPLDNSTFLTLGYFAAARILLHLLASQDATSPPDSCHLIDQCDQILRCWDCFTSASPGGAQLKSFFPLLLVVMYSPEPEQRRRAKQRYLTRHIQSMVFVGMGSAALKGIEKNRRAELRDESF